MADSLEDDFAVADVESVGSDRVVADDGSAKNPLKSKVRLVDKDAGDLTEVERRAKKKRKMKEQDKKRKKKKATNGSALAPGRVATLPPDMQADHLRNLMRSCKQFSKLSAMELDDVAIQDRMLCDSTTASAERNIDNFVEFLRQTAQSILKDTSSIFQAESILTGQPAILVVTGHAQRAADLAKVLRRLLPEKDEDKVQRKPMQVAKLFARHFKVAEQEAFLEVNVCPIAVGTPQRIHDLLTPRSEEKSAALKLDNLRIVILDVSWTDQKMRTLLDGVETKEAVCSLLASSYIQSKIREIHNSNRAMILLF